MKQYLHTIMRSLCIMVMLCGISTSAWAQNFSEGEGSQESPWVITQDTWEEFASSYGSTTEYYFQLGESIVLSEAPSFSLDITSDYLDLNSCYITVGSDLYDLSFPDTFYPVFSDDSGLDDNVTYYFGVSSYSDLQNISNNYDALNSKSNVNISVPNPFVIDSAPTESLNMPSCFSFNDGDITVGDESNPVSFDSSFCPVFSDDSGLDSYVKYYFYIESDGSNWNDFVSFYNDLYNNSNASNVYLVINSDITFEEGQGNDPTETLSIDSGNLIVSDGCKLYVSSDCTCDVFSESSMNESYVGGGAGGYEITDLSSWQEFLAAYNNGDVSDDTPVTINGTIEITSPDSDVMPSSPLTLTNVTFTDGSCITVGTEEEPLDCPDSPYVIFDNEEYESNVKYYYSVNNTLWSNFVSALENLNDRTSITITEDIELGGNYSIPDSPITFSNITFKDEYRVTVGKEGSPYSGAPAKVFESDGLQSYVYYYIELSSDSDWDTYASNYDTYIGEYEHIWFVANNGIDLSSFPDSPYPYDSDHFSYSGSINAGTTDSPLDMKDYVRVFQDEELNKVVYYNVQVTSQEGMEKFAKNASDFDESSDYMYIYANGDKSSFYDYDLTQLDLSKFNDCNATVYADGDVVFFINDKDSEPLNDPDFHYIHTPSYKLIDALFHGAYMDETKRGTFFTESSYDFADVLSYFGEYQGYGTENKPYLIYNLDMLKALVDVINDNNDDFYTWGMYIKLMADINAQGNERLTGIDGSITLEDYEQETVQFPTGFKGHLDGNKHSIAGLTRPLFRSLDNGATVTNLGIVDCNMTGAALAGSARNSTVTMSYVSGVSNGLISEDGNTVKNCYAYNPSLSESDRYTTSTTFNASTVADASGTHNILSGNCYKLTTDVYSDCTLFIPEDNTFYSVEPKTDFFKRYNSGTGIESYMDYINWESDFVWKDNPIKSNVSMLHNVVYRHGWLNNSAIEQPTVGFLGHLDYLYSWYIVDKKELNTDALMTNDGLNNPDMCLRVNNIYYSRGTGAYDGLNTIYLPFAWNPSTDLYKSDGTAMGDAAEVYILADKLSGDEENYTFSDDTDYYDYSNAKSLLFFQPSNDDFAGVSNALPTILKVPSSGWYIKRSGLANFYTVRTDSDYDPTDTDADGLNNLYNQYWEKPYADKDNKKSGRSFMDIDRLSTDDTGRAFHLGTFSGITAGTFDAGTYNSDYSCYKLNSSGTGFAKVTSSSTVQPFRTFFAIYDNGAHANPSSEAPALKLGFCGIYDDSKDDQPTTIDGAPVQGIHLMTTDESKIYSIDGRYVGQYGNKKLAPGMYIMNGKKFVVK